MSNPFWLLTVPNEGRTPEQTFERLRRLTDESGKAYVVQIPSLTVGTLDSLMSLSEDMEKFDAAIEVAVRKIERQYADLSGGRRENLLIDGVPIERYLPSFVWEHAKYPHRRALPELVGSLRTTVGAIEDELKHLATTYADKTQKLSAASRVGGGSGSAGKKGAATTAIAASTAPLEEVIPATAVEGKEFLDTEYLVTCVVIVPKALEETWEASYAKIADTLVTHNQNQKCSPAVPGSATKLHAEGEMAVYSVTLLKGSQPAGAYVDDQWQPAAYVDFVKAYAVAAKELGFVVRAFTYDAEAVAKSARDKDELAAEVDRLHAAILRWSKAHFAEAFVAWMHLKVIRAFVESVLRYGLPVDFVTALLVPSKNREPALQRDLDKMFSHLSKNNLGGPLDDLEGAGGDKKDTDYHAYVLQKSIATTI